MYLFWVTKKIFYYKNLSRWNASQVRTFLLPYQNQISVVQMDQKDLPLSSLMAPLILSASDRISDSVPRVRYILYNQQTYCHWEFLNFFCCIIFNLNSSQVIFYFLKNVLSLQILNCFNYDYTEIGHPVDRQILDLSALRVLKNTQLQWFTVLRQWFTQYPTEFLFVSVSPREHFTFPYMLSLIVFMYNFN